MKIEKLTPDEIERRSFEIIKRELGRNLPPEVAMIIYRVIHTTADFEYADLLTFSPTALKSFENALKLGEAIITDTNMAKSGINKIELSKLREDFAADCNVHCFMADKDIMVEAKKRNVTRAEISMEKAATVKGNPIFVIGNAPTALIRLCELAYENRITPSFVVGAPVGFVNVIQAKEMLMQTDIPYIVIKGRKGGSTVSAAIINALIYKITRSS